MLRVFLWRKKNALWIWAIANSGVCTRIAVVSYQHWKFIFICTKSENPVFMHGFLYSGIYMVYWLVLNVHHKFCCFNIRYISSNILALNSLHFKICTFLLIYTPGLYINERNSRVMVMHIENFTKPHYLVLLMCKSNKKNQLSVFDSILLVYF